MQLSVDLGPDLEAFVQEEVDSGRYRNADEVVHAALILLDEALAVCDRHEERLQGALRDGRVTYLDLPIEVARERNRARLISLGARPYEDFTPALP